MSTYEFLLNLDWQFLNIIFKTKIDLQITSSPEKTWFYLPHSDPLRVRDIDSAPKSTNSPTFKNRIKIS